MNDIRHNSTNKEIDDDFDGRLYVSFTLTGKDLIPDEITTRLGIKPSYSFKRRDLKINSKGKQQIRKLSCWSLDSNNNGLPHNNPMPHFEWLLDILEPVQEELKEILANKKINAQISCFWITPDGRINMELEPELFARLASINIKTWFDIYCNH